MKTAFVKMHGLGNDFVLFHCPDGHISDNDDELADLARDLCRRNTGIGADGMLLVLPSAVADCRMRIFNADGSEAAMCGNGIRCVAKFLADNALIANDRASIETMSGIRRVAVNHDAEGNAASVTVDMGAPSFMWKEIKKTVATRSGDIDIIGLSTGNPHGVVMVHSLSFVPFDTLGPELEKASLWPDRANIEFVQPDEGGHALTVRVWERGVGETLACGTGACAAAAAAVATGHAQWPVTVNLRGGQLSIDMSADGHLLMTGPAVTVFTGNFRQG